MTQRFLEVNGYKLPIESVTMKGNAVDWVRYATGCICETVEAYRQVTAYIISQDTVALVEVIEKEFYGNGPYRRSAMDVRNDGVWMHIYLLIDIAAQHNAKVRFDAYEAYTVKNILTNDPEV